MKVKDLGHLNDPIVLFGSICSNYHALDALAQVVADRNVISTGDLLGFGAMHAETLARLRSLGWPFLARASEVGLSKPLDMSHGSLPGLLFSAIDCLSQEDREWMSSSPDILTFVQRGRRYAAVGRDAVARLPILWPSSPENDFDAARKELERIAGAIDGVLVGRSGITFHRVVKSAQWVDVGAIGLPPHDSRPETRYAVLDDGEITFQRLNYDHHAAARAARTASHANDLATTLETGIWPTEETLPPELRRLS